MKIKLTQKWKQCGYGKASDAFWNDIYLRCEKDYTTNRQVFIGTASLHPVERPLGEKPRIIIQRGGVSCKLIGPSRKSVAKARRDAEKLAIELLLNIRDGTDSLIKQYGIIKDD